MGASACWLLALVCTALGSKWCWLAKESEKGPIHEGDARTQGLGLGCSLGIPPVHPVREGSQSFPG